MKTLSLEPDRVVFGLGAESAVANLLIELGAQRVLLIAQSRHAEGAHRIKDALGLRATSVFTTDVAQVPAEVVDAAVATARAAGVDWVIGHGGGTPIGIAKAIALQLPVLVGAVPTTYAGSERTNVWGITRDGRKLTGRDDRVRPRLVVYDPCLTLDLDRGLSLDSLFNALAHSVEALYAADATTEALRAAEDSLKPLISGLLAVAAEPSDIVGRSLALRGAGLASTALGGASMGLHHQLAHTIGGRHAAPHARIHATLLPYTLGFNAPAVPVAMDIVARALGTDDPPAFLYDLQRRLGLATSLRTLGLSQDGLAAIADEALQSPYPNPRPLDHASLLGLLDDGLHDRRPSLRTRRMAMPTGADGPHATMSVTLRGAPLENARAVVLAFHGRGASADRFAADLERRIGACDDVTFVAPQARDNTWYPQGFLAPVADNQPWFDSALSVVESLFRDLCRTVDPVRIVIVGFSQGACLALTWLSQTASSPRRLLAFTGAPTPLPTATYENVGGVEIHFGCAENDLWIKRDVFDAGVARFVAAGAQITTAIVPGAVHDIHAPDEEALRSAVKTASGATSEPRGPQQGPPSSA